MSLFDGTLFAAALLFLSANNLGKCEPLGLSPARLFLNKYYANIAQQKENSEAPSGNCISPIPPPSFETQTVQNEVVTQPVVTEIIQQGPTNIALNNPTQSSCCIPSEYYQSETSNYVSDVLPTQISSPVENQQGEYYPQIYSVPSEVQTGSTTFNTLPSPNVQEVVQVPMMPNRHFTSGFNPGGIVTPRAKNKQCQNTFIVTPTKPEPRKNNAQGNNQFNTVSSSSNTPNISQCSIAPSNQELPIQVPIIPQVTNNYYPTPAYEGFVIPNIAGNPQGAIQKIQVPPQNIQVSPQNIQDVPPPIIQMPQLNEGYAIPNIAENPQAAVQNIQVPIMPRACNVPTVSENQAYMTPPQIIENYIPRIEQPSPVNIQVPMMPKVSTATITQSNQEYATPSIVATPQYNNYYQTQYAQEPNQPVSIQVPIVPQVANIKFPTPRNEGYVVPNIAANTQEAIRNIQVPSAMQSSYIAPQTIPSDSYITTSNTYAPTPYTYIQESVSPILEAIRNIQVPSAIQSSYIAPQTIPSDSYITTSNTYAPTPYTYIQESVSPIQTSIMPVPSTGEQVIQNIPYIVPNVQQTQGNVFVVTPYAQEQNQAPVRIQIPPISTTVQAPSNPAYVVTPTVSQTALSPYVPSYKGSCPVKIPNTPQINPYITVATPVYTETPQEVYPTTVPEYYPNFDIPTSLTCNYPDLSYLNECYEYFGANEVPLNLNINMQPPAEQVIAVISQAAPAQDPGVYQQGQAPMLPPVIVMDKSKSKWKNLLPIMLLALLDRNGGNSEGCSQTSYSYIPYPISFPINNPIMCGSGSKNSDDIDDDDDADEQSEDI